MPFVNRSRPLGARFFRESGTELVALLANDFIRYDDATLGRQELDIPQARADQVIEPDGMANDFRGKAAMIKGPGGGFVPQSRETRVGWPDQVSVTMSLQAFEYLPGHNAVLRWQVLFETACHL